MILVYGYGNPGREDDGLGVMLADLVEKEHIPGVSVEKNYQLNAEDALTIAEYDLVVFADASRNDINDFRFSAVCPESSVCFTSHSMTPGGVLALCRQLYEKNPPAYLLEIKGTSWEINEELSQDARPRLTAALKFLRNILSSALPIVTAAGQAA